MNTTTVASAMRNNQHNAIRAIAIALSVLVYVAGLFYAAVRTYTLFTATIAAEYISLAIVGIVALEISAVALPLAIHYWTAPGLQRVFALLFYAGDLALIGANAILDAARHGGIQITFLESYAALMLPATPLLCMAGWSIIWLADPTSRERDMTNSVRAATFAALLDQIQRAAESTDISAAVGAAADSAATAIVLETLGHFPAAPATPRLASPSPAPPRAIPHATTPTTAFAAEAPAPNPNPTPARR